MEKQYATIPDLVVEHSFDSNNANTSIEQRSNDDAETQSIILGLYPEENVPRNKSPVTVQEWVDSLPVTPVSDESREIPDSEVAKSLLPASDNLSLGAEALTLNQSTSNDEQENADVIVNSTGNSPNSSDLSSTSVDSLLEARKPDPEEVLLNLGFGCRAANLAFESSRIPTRFLRPSKLKGVDLEAFLQYQQDLIQTFESGFYGYRGLAGPSHSSPSIIVAKILEKLKEHGREEQANHSATQNKIFFNNATPGHKFSDAANEVLTKIRCTPGSVLTPDNRRWLESQGKKSPEVPRRIIIGQQSFIFGRDGDLIESPASSVTHDSNTKDNEETE